MVYKSYVGIQLTLADGLAHNLLALLRAVDAGCPGTGKEITIQAQTGNAGAVSIGDSSIGAARKGYELSAGESRTYRSNLNDIPLADFYVMGAAAGLKINVEVL